METTEVVSQLDPKFRKVWHGMAGNRFWSVRFSAMLVVGFDSDQPRSAPRGGRGPSSEPASAGCNAAAHRHAQGRVSRLRPQAPGNAFGCQVRGAAGMVAARGTGTDCTGMPSRPAGAGYPCWNLNLAYLRNPHWTSNIFWRLSHQKNYHLENYISVP